jgi:hypothetical protein
VNDQLGRGHDTTDGQRMRRRRLTRLELVSGVSMRDRRGASRCEPVPADDLGE